MTDEDRQALSQLLDAWDPIGVYLDPEYPAYPGEYERLMPAILNKLDAGADQAEIAAYLAWDAKTMMSLDGFVETEPAAKSIALWWNGRHRSAPTKG